jgi:hypothetical protein
MNNVSESFRGVQVKVEGIAELNRAIRKTGADASDMKDLMYDIGMLVIRAATPPVKSGKLSGSMRAGKGKTKAIIRAGGARVPYAPIVHYGNPKRGIGPQPFLLQALQNNREQVVRTINDGIEDILKRNYLK